jgi:FkbM family methyltransferase
MFANKIKQLGLRLLPSALAGRLRAWRVRWTIAHHTARVVKHNYGGGALTVLIADPLAEGWYDRDWSELPEIAALRSSRLRPGALVFDIGAHQGVVALMLAREVGREGRVVAVEPNAHNVAVARKNCELNAMQQVEVVQSAVSDRNGPLFFAASLNGQLDDGTGAAGRVRVESMTVDAMAQVHGSPDVVFVDVEGAEALVLAGAAQVLAGDADFFVEMHVGCGLEKLGGSVDRVVSFFPQDRFTLMFRREEDSCFRQFTPDDPITQHRFFLLALRTR